MYLINLINIIKINVKKSKFILILHDLIINTFRNNPKKLFVINNFINLKMK